MTTPPPQQPSDQPPQWPQQENPAPQGQQPSKGRPVRAIIVAVCLVIVAATTVIALVKNHDPDSSKAGSSTALPNGDGRTTTRPGFGAEASSVADPAPLQDSAPSAPVRYRGTAVVQACNLLTLADMRRIGVRLNPNPLPNTVNFERTYLAPDGAGPLSTSSLGFASADGFALNKCYFAFTTKQSQNEYVGVAVSQRAYQPGADIDLGLAAESYVHKPDIGNVAVYSHRAKADHPGDARGDAVLRLGGVTADMTFDLHAKGIAGKLDALALAIGHNLSAQVAAPQGPRPIAYKSPIYPASVAQPCRLLTPAAFTSAYHVAASPLVVEQPGTAVGTTVFPGDPQSYDYVTMSCERGTGSDDPGDRRALVLEATSYISQIAAKKHLGFDRANHGGQAPAARLGDESTVETGGTGVASAVKGVLLVRKGRFVFELRAADQEHHPNGLTVREANSILVPAARQILQRLGNQS